MNRPNVLFILSDDQGAWALHCAGNEDIFTPNLDRLAAEGVMFDNFFCASPVCSPARASILTGTIPSRHGVMDWLSGGNLPSGIAGMEHLYGYSNETKPIPYTAHLTAYTDLLQEAGYTCALSGKWHMGDSLHAQHGFSRWYTLGRGGCDYYQADVVENGRICFPEGYVTDLIAENALKNLEELAGGEAPFYLSVHFTAPHSPWEEKDHPKEMLDLYRDCEFTATPDLPLHPKQVKTCPYGTGERRKELLRGYYAAITAMDLQIGRILDKLKELGIRENTLIFFTSDNGMNLGQHGVWGKGNGTFPQNMYDSSVKVPFLASWKGRLPEGARCSELFSHYDILPTLQQLLGLKGKVIQPLPGRSFAEWLWQPEKKEERCIVILDEYGPVRMIRNKEWKLVLRYPYGPNELYDLKNDPEEERNLYGEASCSERVIAMKKQLESWFLTYEDPRMDGTKQPVTGTGQFGVVGRDEESIRCFGAAPERADAQPSPGCPHSHGMGGGL